MTVPVTTGDKPVADNVTNEPTVKPIENRMAKKQQQMISKEQSIQQMLEGTTVTVDNPHNLQR